jgi:hypothetical protein
MKNIIIEYDKFEDQKLWESFIAFFKYVKGYNDWTDEEIAISMNKDDFKEYCEWAKKILEIEG